MGLRETAWRTTTRELELATVEERGVGEKAASYLLSPFGARLHRVVLAGSLATAEPIGRETPSAFWRSRLTDPLGRVTVTAGSFQPRAMAQLRAAPPQRPAIVVGKAHLYRGASGSPSVSVRAEAVRPVPEAEERAMLAEITRQALDRLDLVDRLEHEPKVTDEELRTGGWPSLWVRAARLSLRTYPTADRASYRGELRAMVSRVSGLSAPTDGARVPEGVTVRFDPPPVAPAPLTPGEQEEAATFLASVDAAADGSEDGYADLREVMRRLSERGVGSGRAEALLGRLEEGGLLEEPIVGKLRRA